jgi:hypothetical protein
MFIFPTLFKEGNAFNDEFSNKPVNSHINPAHRTGSKTHFVLVCALYSRRRLRLVSVVDFGSLQIKLPVARHKL